MYVIAYFVCQFTVWKQLPNPFWLCTMWRRRRRLWWRWWWYTFYVCVCIFDLYLNIEDIALMLNVDLSWLFCWPVQAKISLSASVKYNVIQLFMINCIIWMRTRWSNILHRMKWFSMGFPSNYWHGCWFCNEIHKIRWLAHIGIPATINVCLCFIW